MKAYKLFKGVSDTSTRMMFRVPYLMVLYYSMAIYETDEIPTLAVNGTSMWVNPKFWNQLSREQKLTALVHEIFHKMLLHNSRRGARDPFIYNEAGDHYINNRLVAMKFVPLENLTIDGESWSWLCDPKYADPKWTTEAIYDDIVREREAKHEQEKQKEQDEEDGRGEEDGEGENGGDEAEGDEGDADDPQSQPGGASDGSGDGDGEGEGEGEDQGPAEGDGSGGQQSTDEIGDVGGTPRRIGSEESEKKLGPMRDLRDFGMGPDDEPDPADTDESVKQFEDRVKKELKEAENRAKMAGNVPGWLERVIGKVFHAKANWYDTLYEYLKGMSKADYSWRRFSKRELVKTGCVAPDMYQPSMGGILKFIDTSGSVTGTALALYDKHMVDVIDQVKPRWVALAYWDTQLHRLDKFERYEYDLDTSMLKPVGGGGTDFRGWQDVIDEMDEPPEVVLAYTDMEATFPEQELSVPTVWLSTSQINEAPFGTVININ